MPRAEGGERPDERDERDEQDAPAVTGLLQAALDWARSGWAVFPLLPRRKEPLLARAHPKPVTCRGKVDGCDLQGHGVYDATRDEATIRAWWFKNPNANVGGAAGSGRLVVDVDPRKGGTADGLPETRRHATGGLDGGSHWVYELAPDAVGVVLSGDDRFGPGRDCKTGDGSYIMLPPSIHPISGNRYAVADARKARVLTRDDLPGLFVSGDGSGGPGSARRPGRSHGGAPGGSGASGASGGGSVRSTQSKLLANPPVGEGSGRNSWLTQNAGHYAKLYRAQEDLYRVHCNLAAKMLKPPLDEAEVAKTVASAWDMEHRNHPERDLTPETGWLVGKGDEIWTRVKLSEGEGGGYAEAQWADFDLKVNGVVIDPERERAYDVTVHRKRDGAKLDDLLEAGVTADQRKLAAWLANHGVAIVPPDNISPRGGGRGERLTRYLESQGGPQSRVAHWLGQGEESDGEDGFVTFEGVITGEGRRGFEKVRPAPGLRKVIDFHYGWEAGGEREAIEVLREILTFHDETVAAVFGSWWAATFVKREVMQRTALFPIMGIQGTSGTGKTTGMFAKLIELGGNRAGQGDYTKASFRDVIGAHRNGVAWLDDPDSVEDVASLLRQATAEGSIVKKGEDRSRNVTAKLVAPIVLSGEGLRVGGEKALRDRVLLLHVGGVSQRRSVKEGRGDRLQWEDVQELRRKWPDLTVHSGWIVAAMLREGAKLVGSGELEKLRTGVVGSGRHADKLAVVRLGARMLDAVTGEGRWAKLADEWVQRQEDLGEENRLTLTILPECLKVIGPWEKLYRYNQPPFWGVPFPVLVHEGGLWVNIGSLAVWWRKHMGGGGRIQERTDTEQALAEQATKIGMKGVKAGKRGTDWIRPRVENNPSDRPVYQRVPDEIAMRVAEEVDLGAATLGGSGDVSDAGDAGDAVDAGDTLGGVQQGVPGSGRLPRHLIEYLRRQAPR
jgi:hypothetical protein